MKVCFFGAYDRAYPRNQILREGLMRAGCKVVEAHVGERRVVWRYPELFLRHREVARTADVLVVPEFRHKDMGIARWLRGRRPLVFDPLVSRHDTLVGDWGLHREGSAQARWNRGIDRWAMSLADRVLCDTWAHGDLFTQLGLPRERLRCIPVGAEDRFFEIGEPPVSPIHILYVGGFLPLHGVNAMLEAVARLIAAPGGAGVRVTMAGSGIDYRKALAYARVRGLTHVSFPGRVSVAQATALLADAQIVLGAFGSTAKAGRVIPHKVYQGLAAGRAVVTGDGPGVRELFEQDVHLILVPRDDPDALAASLERLIADRPLRRVLGHRGRERVRQVASVGPIGQNLRAVLEELIG